MSNLPKRRRVPLKTQLEVALRQLGLNPATAELDHAPALQLRPIAAGEWVPHQHDPNHLIWLDKEVHRIKTTGRKGTSKLSITGDGDVSRIAKVKRLVEKRDLKEAELIQFLVEDSANRIAEMKKNPKFPKGKPAWPQGRKIASRPFPKKKET
jgi:hypothetical protein